MKKIILIALLCLLPNALFSYEVNFNKKFTITVTPDLLSTHITISIESMNEKYINENIEKFNNYIKSNSNVIKNNGSFTLSPKHRYHKNKQEFTGYVGTLRYEIESRKAKELNIFMDKLIKMKNNIDLKKIELNISNISWKTSRDLYETSLEKLRLSTILWVEGYSTSLSKDLNKICTINKIDINTVQGINLMRHMDNISPAVKKSYLDVAPENSQQNITINPTFVLECK